MEMEVKARNKLLKKVILGFLIFIIVLMVIPTQPVQAADWDNDGMDNDTTEAALITLYSPNLQFTGGENFFPVDFSYHLDNSRLYQWTDPSTRTLVLVNPDLTTLGSRTDQYFLDNELGGYAEILTDYTANMGVLGYTIYARVIMESSQYCIQFWFFYAYNDAASNQHEGDWEMITIILDNSQVPISAVYSQHFVAETAAWADVEKTDTTHPMVYVSRGSHANYFRYYQGRVGLEQDEVGNDGFYLPYDDAALTIEQIGEKGALNHPAPSQNWIDFQGRWGDWVDYYDTYIGFAGPSGPWNENAEKWDTPYTYSQSGFGVNSSWFILCWIMYYLLWIFIGFFVLQFIWKLAKAIKTRTADDAPKLSIVLGGRAAFGVFLIVITMGIAIAVIFLPWYAVYASVTTPVISSEGNIVLIDGLHGFQLNFLVAGSGMTSLMNAAIPFYILLATGTVLTCLDIGGARSARKLGNKFIISGLITFGILIIQIVLMTQIGTLTSAVAPMFGGSLPPEIVAMMNAIAANPFTGTYSTTLYSVIDIDLVWGFMIGGFLIIGSACIKIFAGIIMKTTPEKA